MLTGVAAKANKDLKFGAVYPGPRLAPFSLTLHRGRCAPVPPGVAVGVAVGVACDGRAGTIALRVEGRNIFYP